MAIAKDLAFLQGIGIDVSRGEHTLRHHRSRLAEHLVAKSSRDTFRKECILMVCGLWGAAAFERKSTDEMSKAIEMMVKALLFNMPQKLPTIDWARLAADAEEQYAQQQAREKADDRAEETKTARQEETYEASGEAGGPADRITEDRDRSEKGHSAKEKRTKGDKKHKKEKKKKDKKKKKDRKRKHGDSQYGRSRRGSRSMRVERVPAAVDEASETATSEVPSLLPSTSLAARDSVVERPAAESAMPASDFAASPVVTDAQLVGAEGAVEAPPLGQSAAAAERTEVVSAANRESALGGNAAGSAAGGEAAAGGAAVAVSGAPGSQQAAATGGSLTMALPRPPMPIEGPSGAKSKFAFETKPPSYEKFAVQRTEIGFYDPAELLREQMTPGFQLPGGDFATEFCYSPVGDTREEQLWRWWKELARCGIYVDMVYWHTPHHKLINAWGYQGCKPVPAVATMCGPSSTGPSINWHITKPDGRLRVDGKPAMADIVVKMLRWGFQARNASIMNAFTLTSQARQRYDTHGQSMDDLRAKWAAAKKDMILAVPHGMIYDGMGKSGIWDVLHLTVGTKGAPYDNTIPWVIFTKPRVTVLVHKNGKVGLQIGSASPAAADAVVQAIVERLGAQWLSKMAFLASLGNEGGDKIRFGVPSPTAMMCQRSGQEQAEIL